MNRFLAMGIAMVASPLLAVEVPKKVPEHTLVIIKLAPTESISVVPLVGKGTEASTDQQGGTFYMTGPPGLYVLAVIDASIVGDPGQQTVQVKQAYHQLTIVPKNPVPPDPPPPTPPDPPDPPPPGPPTPPDPTLSELAKFVAAEAEKIHQPAKAKRVGEIYLDVSNRLASGELATVQAATLELGRLTRAENLSSEWVQFGRALQQHPDAAVTNRATMIKICRDLAAGLFAASLKP